MKKFISIIVLSLITIVSQATVGDCKNPIGTAAFKSQLKKIQAQDFDEAKKEAVQNFISNNCFTSQQVKSLLEQLSFEEDKLELAKLAYSKVTDKTNFKIILQVFEFDMAKKELESFINKK